MHRLPECFYAIQKEEGRTNHRYGLVLRMRPDHVLLRPLPRATIEGGWMGEALSPGRVLLWDDQFAAARRDDAAAILLAPELVYTTCADEAQWRRATLNLGREVPPEWNLAACRETGLVPCTVMGLVSVFGGATSWREISLEPRGWLPRAGPARPESETFCIRRAKVRANETSRGTFHEGVGMSC